ncbi:MAG: CHAD domain-containing protein [Acidobacteriota bacterium]
MTESEQAQAVQQPEIAQEEEQTAASDEIDFPSLGEHWKEEIDFPSLGEQRKDDALVEPESPAESSPADAPPATAQAPSDSRRLAEIIPSQLATLRQHHYAVVTTDEVEAVHKMRVTTRKLQASLDLLEGQMNVRPLKRRLRRWRRMLSTVRNYDVFLLLIEQESEARRGAREQYELLKTVLEKRRASRAARVKKYLGKVDVVEQLGTKLGLSSAAMSSLWEQPLAADTETSEPAADFVDIETPPLEPGDSPELEASDSPELEGGDSPELEATFPAIDDRAAAMRAADRLEQRMAEFNALVARSHPTTDPRELHQLRIAAKRVRYLLEAVTAMGFGDASQALTWLRALQDRIGDWHDLEALEEEIVQLVTRRKFTREHLPEAAGLLLAATILQKRKNLLVSRLFPVRVPAGLSATSRRLVRALRRSAVNTNAPNPDPLQASPAAQ